MADLVNAAPGPDAKAEEREARHGMRSVGRERQTPLDPVSLHSGLSSWELDRITSYMDSLRSFIPNIAVALRGSITDPGISAIVEKILRFVASVNDEHFRLDINEHKFLLYRNCYTKGASLFWHWDFAEGFTWGDPEVYKLGVSIQLSESSDYDGGGFYTWADEEHPVQHSRDRGMAVVFPTFVLHKVATITRGTRNSLNLLVRGPNFR
jgi:PKHD-type hydroxylase